MKKILITSENYYPYGGGIEQYIRGLATFMTKQGISVDILTQRYENHPDEEQMPEAHVYYSPLLVGSLADPFSVLNKVGDIAAFIKKGEYDLVYSNNHNSLAVIAACKQLGMPVVYGCHGIGLFDPTKGRFLNANDDLNYGNVDYASGVHSFYVQARAAGVFATVKFFLGLPVVLKRIAQYRKNHTRIAQADGIIAVSALLANFFPQHKRKYSLLLGVDMELYAPKKDESVLQRYGISGDYIVCTSRIHHTKGQLYAVQALKELPEDVSLVLVGNTSLFHGKQHEYGAYGDEIKQYIQEHGLEERVVFTGFVEAEELAVIYSGARATVVPSVWFEPCAYVTLESMACETPVVITVNSGSAEIVSPDVGRIVARKDPQAIARAVKEMWNDSEAMGKRARVRIETYQSWESVGEQTMRVFEDVLEDASNE